MKQPLLLFLFLFSCSNLFSQSENQGFPLTVNYFSFLGIQPGLKLGTAFDLKKWDSNLSETERKRSLYLSPQMGLYTYPSVHTSSLLNVDIGYKRIKNKNGRFTTLALGLGYLNQLQNIEQGVSLNGTTTPVREAWHWFLPSVSYGFGKIIHDQWAWNGKVTYGSKRHTERAPASLVFLELGCIFYLGK